MIIETERLIIRDFTLEDSGDLFEILGDDETMKNCEPAYDYPKTEDFLRDFCIRKKGAVGAVLKENQKLIGYILFNEYEKDNYEIGWFFNKKYWNRGFAYESCKAIISYAFSSLGAKKIFAETTDGEKSLHLMEKLGMKPESTELVSKRNSNSELCTLYVYSINFST